MTIRITCTRNQLLRLFNNITAALNHDVPEFTTREGLGWPQMVFIQTEDPNAVPKVETSEEA